MYAAEIPAKIVSNAKAFEDAASGLATVFTQAAEAVTTGTAAATGVIAAAAAVMAGTTIILAVAAAILTAAIDIVVKAETARTTLVGHLDAAKTDVDIAAFVKDSEAFGHYWALGTAGDTAVCANPVGSLVLPCSQYTQTVLSVGGATNVAFQAAQVNGFRPSFAQLPSITSAAATSFPPNAASVFTITTTGTSPKITLSGTLPSGLSFADNGDGTAKISGTPAANALGVHTLTVKAANDVGGATQSFRLTVGTPPSFTSVPALVFTEGLSSTFTIRATGDPTPTLNIHAANDVVICDLITGACSSPSAGKGNLPSGVTFQANGDGTATISGTPGGRHEQWQRLDGPVRRPARSEESGGDGRSGRHRHRSAPSSDRARPGEGVDRAQEQRRRRACASISRPRYSSRSGHRRPGSGTAG